MGSATVGETQCLSLITREINNIPETIIILIKMYSAMGGVVIIIGNAMLIWTLHRTGQMKTASLQLITLMSVSDLCSGIVCLSISPSLLDSYSCWLTLGTQLILFTSNSFSILMLVLVALDRYLHMKYLERYPVVVTKKKGYSMILIAFLSSLSAGIMFILPMNPNLFRIFESVGLASTIVPLTSVLVLYHHALRALRRNSQQATRSIISQNRSLGKAAKRISICILILSAPIIILYIIDHANRSLNFLSPSVVNVCIWVAYVTFLINGFCSSVIFISQNIPIRRYLGRVIRYYASRIRSVVAPMETNV